MNGKVGNNLVMEKAKTHSLTYKHGRVRSPSGRHTEQRSQFYAGGGKRA